MNKKELELAAAEEQRKLMYEFKISFNMVVMHEMNLDVNDSDHIFHIEDDESESIWTIKGKFIKASEDEYPIIGPNEIDMNLIENPRLMELLFKMWITIYCRNHAMEETSCYQSSINGSNLGFFAFTYTDSDGVTKEIKSDNFINESVRILNLICKLNHTAHRYDFSHFDIEIVRDGD